MNTHTAGSRGAPKEGRDRRRECALSGRDPESDWPTGTGVVYPNKHRVRERVKVGGAMCPAFTTPTTAVRQSGRPASDAGLFLAHCV